jgi:hypothetical protein
VGRATLAIGSVALCLGVAGHAATPLPETLDVQAMALAAGDFDGGAKIASQGFQSASAPVVAVYERSFRPGARLAGKRLLVAQSVVSIFADDHTAAAVFESIRATLATSSGRRAFAKAILGGRNLKGVSITVERPVMLRLGQGAFRLSIPGRVSTSLGRIRLDFALTVLRVDRALGLVGLAGYPATRLTGAPAVRATTKLAQHFQVGFTVRNLAPPNVVGTPQQKQTLTADSGRWAGAPSVFTYQWNRCDTAGTSCAAIPGATGQTYVLGAQDSATRLAVSVKAANSVSSFSMTSSATPLVP